MEVLYYRIHKKPLLLRDGFKCAYCKIELNVDTVTMDHIIPVSRQGKHRWQNVVACCFPCNQKKKARTPKEAGMELDFTPYAPVVGTLPKFPKKEK